MTMTHRVLALLNGVGKPLTKGYLTGRTATNEGTLLREVFFDNAGMGTYIPENAIQHLGYERSISVGPDDFDTPEDAAGALVDWLRDLAVGDVVHVKVQAPETGETFHVKVIVPESGISRGQLTSITKPGKAGRVDTIPLPNGEWVAEEGDEHTSYYTSADFPSEEGTWSVYREKYPTSWAEEPIDGTQEHVSTHPDEATAEAEAARLQGLV